MSIFSLLSLCLVLDHLPASSKISVSTAEPCHWSGDTTQSTGLWLLSTLTTAQVSGINISFVMSKTFSTPYPYSSALSRLFFFFLIQHNSSQTNPLTLLQGRAKWKWIALHSPLIDVLVHLHRSSFIMIMIRGTESSGCRLPSISAVFLLYLNNFKYVLTFLPPPTTFA